MNLLDRLAGAAGPEGAGGGSTRVGRGDTRRTLGACRAHAGQTRRRERSGRDAREPDRTHRARRRARRRQWTSGRRKESLQRVLNGSHGDAGVLQIRLSQLLGSWDQDGADSVRRRRSTRRRRSEAGASPASVAPRRLWQRACSAGSGAVVPLPSGPTPTDRRTAPRAGRPGPLAWRESGCEPAQGARRSRGERTGHGARRVDARDRCAGRDAAARRRPAAAVPGHRSRAAAPTPPGRSARRPVPRADGRPRRHGRGRELDQGSARGDAPQARRGHQCARHQVGERTAAPDAGAPARAARGAGAGARRAQVADEPDAAGDGRPRLTHRQLSRQHRPLRAGDRRRGVAREPDRCRRRNARRDAQRAGTGRSDAAALADRAFPRIGAGSSA